MVGPVFAPAGTQIGWLVLAVVLHVCGQVSRGVAWRGVLAATWPAVTRRRVCAWYVCGAGLSGVLSPRGGDAVRVTLARRELPDATWTALAGTLCAEASFETVSGLTMMLAAVALGVGSLHAPPVALLVAAAGAAPPPALAGARPGPRQPPPPAGRAARGRGGRGSRRGAARRALGPRAPDRARDRPRRRRAAQAGALRPSGAALPGGRARPAGGLGDLLPARLRPAGAAGHRRRRRPRAGLRSRGAAPWRGPGGHRSRTARRAAVGRRARARRRRLGLAGRRLAGGAHGRGCGHLADPPRAALRRPDAAGARARRALAAAAARAHHPVTAALGWGALAASSLIIGALLGLARAWPDRAVGIVLAFGAGALVSAVSFDLAQEGLKIGSGAAVGGGLAVGALTYFGLDRLVERRASGGGAGPALALGAFLDGLPEQAVLGIGLASGEGVSVSLLAAIFVSNLPEAIGSSSEMRAAGSRPATIRRLWIAVAIVCTLASVAGYAIADSTSGDFKAAINGFAAGALLVMLIDSMIPEAARKAGDVAGLVTVLGFAVATAL